MLLLACLGVGWFFFWRPLRNTDLLWDFVPENALWVYEHPDLGALMAERMENHPISTFSEGLLKFSLLDNGDIFWKIWSKREADWRLFTQNLPIKISGHVVSDKKLGILFYISLSEEKTRNLRRLFSLFYKKGSGFQTTSQKHGARTLYVLSKKGSSQKFLYLIGKNYFVASFTPLLLEEVLRKTEAKESISYLSKQKQSNMSFFSFAGGKKRARWAYFYTDT